MNGMDDYMSKILEGLSIHADRDSAHLNKKKTDLETTIKVLEDSGQPIPVELLAALHQLDEDIEGSGDEFRMMSDALTGNIQTPGDESADVESESVEPMGTWSQQKYVDSSPYGQLTRDVNEEMASRPHFKVFVPQVFGWDEYRPFYDIEAQVAHDDATAKPIGINRLNTSDAMPKLKVAKEWAEKVDIRSPTAHREWIATDSACGSKESKAKLNRLLKELIQLEVAVTFYFAMCHPSNKKRTKVIQDGFMVVLMLPDEVRKSVQDIVMTKMRSQLKNLYAFYKQDSFRLWGEPLLGELAARNGDSGDPANKVAPHNDSGDDESSAEEEDLDKPPVMSCVLTPYGPKFLQGGPKRNTNSRIFHKMDSIKTCPICDTKFISRNNAQFCDACLSISNSDPVRVPDNKSTTAPPPSPPDNDVLLENIKNQKATIFSLEDLPPSLTNWDYFISSLSPYRMAMGVALKFVRFDNNVWHKVSSEVPMSVDRWLNWYINCRNKNEAIYLVGIPVLAKDLLALRKLEPISSFTFGGAYCLSRYSDDPNILNNNVVINIAPPWGQVMVFPHLAGQGACTSILCQTMGPKTTFKVDYWNRLDAGEQKDFEEVAQTAFTEMQLLQPDATYKVDNSFEWDTLLSMRLRALGIRSETHDIKLGHAILLPPSQFYAYKFYHNNTINDKNAIPCMVLSAYGDFMGHDEYSFDRNFWSLYRLRRRMIEVVESLIKLLFFCLAEFKYKPTDNICKEHAKAAVGILKELILRQDLRLTWNHQLFGEVRQMLQMNSSNDSTPQPTNQHVIWLDPPSKEGSPNGNKRKRDQSEMKNEEPAAKRQNLGNNNVALSKNAEAVYGSASGISEDDEVIDLNS